MPGEDHPSPLDYVVKSLELLALQMRRHLERGESITVEDFRAIMLFVEWLATEFKSLQAATIQEPR